MLRSSWNLEIQNVFHESMKATLLLLDPVNTTYFLCWACNVLFVQDDNFRTESTTQNYTSVENIARVHIIRCKTGGQTSPSVAASVGEKKLRSRNATWPRSECGPIFGPIRCRYHLFHCRSSKAAQTTFWPHYLIARPRPLQWLLRLLNILFSVAMYMLQTKHHYSRKIGPCVLA